MAEQMWRVVALFRIVTLAYAGILIIVSHDSYAHPAAGLIVLAAMAVWTAVTVAAYARPAGRARWVIAADVAVAAAVILSTRWIDTAARIKTGAPTLPTSWAAAPILACAVAGGPWTGLAGAAVTSVALFAEHPALPQSTFSGIVLLLIAGGVGGYVMRLGLRAEAAVDRVARREAAIAERERIARGIHDSVLQVLALVSSRGRALGGEAAELGALAAEQENALRTLVSHGAADHDAGQGLLDVRALLEPFTSSQISVSCPATAVLLSKSAAQALAAATGEALDNVRLHAGPGARAWVLVEDDGPAVTVSIRDDGRGIAAGRLAEAAGRGRLGVSHSIIGRMRDAGGTASLTSSPGNGTEVELGVARD
jgi:signal transduction histidine kinase